jgi:hypothetical protein
VTAVSPRRILLLASTIAPLPIGVALVKSSADTSALFPMPVLKLPVVLLKSALSPLAVLKRGKSGCAQSDSSCPLLDTDILIWMIRAVAHIIGVDKVIRAGFRFISIRLMVKRLPRSNTISPGFRFLICSKCI